MAKLYKHGHAVVEYRRTRKLDSGTEYETIFRVMSDGKILKQVKFLGEHKHSTNWKLTPKLKAEIVEQPDLLIAAGFTKVTL